MQANKLRPALAKAAEQHRVPRQRQAREIQLEELRVALPVARRVENGIGVIENVFRPEGLLQIAAPVGNELKTERLRELLHKLRRQVRAPAVLMRNQFALRFGFSVRIEIEREDGADVEDGDMILVAGDKVGRRKAPKSSFVWRVVRAQGTLSPASRCLITLSAGRLVKPDVVVKPAEIKGPVKAPLDRLCGELSLPSPRFDVVAAGILDTVFLEERRRRLLGEER